MEEDHIRNHLVELLKGGNAHATFFDAVEGLDMNTISQAPNDLPYSIWQLVFHIRFAQADIVNFSINQYYQTPKWPDEFWPVKNVPQNITEFKNTINAYEEDLNKIIELVKDPVSDLFTPFAHGNGQNLFREAILIADHTAYHTGQIIVIRRLLGKWPN